MALSMRERLALQKSVKQSLATLRGGQVGMRERLSLQKQVKADMAKLGGQASASPEGVTRDNTSVGDTVEWRNEMGTIAGNFRGITDDGRHAVIVHGGMQSSAPIGEVFQVDDHGAKEPSAHERITAALEAGNASDALRILQEFDDRVPLSEALIKAGFKVSGGTVPEIIQRVWPSIQQKAQAANSDATTTDSEQQRQYEDEYADIGGPDDEAPMQRARRLNKLSEQVNYQGEAVTRKRLVEKMLAEGRQPVTREENKVKPMSRRAYFNANNEQQQAHEKRMKEAGTKTVYTLADDEFETVVTKIEYDYALYLLSKRPAAPDSLTAQAARGDFNHLALPEFIEKLKDAYSADEDLGGAKEAAIAYLQANQDELEAA